MKQLIALSLVATFLLLVSSTALAATRVPLGFAVVAGAAATQPEDDSSEDTVSTWDRTWPVILAAGSFFLFRYLRNRPTDDD